MQQAVQRWQSRRRYRRDSGFTIVELLIVIIVIAILALIIITTYNVVQAKARNTQRVATAKEYQKLITNYITAYGVYPTADTSTRRCLGSGYPTDWDANLNEDCYATTAIRHPLPALNTELMKIAPQLPDFNKSPIATSEGALLLGITYRPAMTVNGQAGRVVMEYFLEGANQDCRLRPLTGDASTTTTLSGSATNSGNVTTTATRCVVLLPDPSEL